MDDSPQMTDPNGAPAPSPLRRYLPHVLWIALIGVVVVTQWRVIYGGASGEVGPAGEAEIAWRTDWDAARAEAAATGRPILADFTADWCPPCQAMKRDTWPDDRVEQAIDEGFVPLLVDIDQPMGAELARRYGVTMIPTILLLDAEGGVLRTGSFMDADEMRAFLQRAG